MASVSGGSGDLFATKTISPLSPIAELVVGDLIIDTYLRLRLAPTVLLDDPYLLVVIRQALKDVDFAFGYFLARPTDNLPQHLHNVFVAWRSSSGRPRKRDPSSYFR